MRLGLAALVAVLVYRRRARVSGRAAKDQPVRATAVILGAVALAYPSNDPVSPELALVDPTLRERIAMDEQAQAAPEVHPPDGVPAVETDVSTGHAVERRRSRRLVGGAAGIAATCCGCRCDDRAHRDVSSRRISCPCPDGRHRIRLPRPHVSGPSGRSFAWAPVERASEYDVEIRRNGEVVYTATTSVPHVRVPAQWERGGLKLTLSPGAYRWYVWPVLGAGGRRGAAVVATTFLIH